MLSRTLFSGNYLPGRRSRRRSGAPVGEGPGLMPALYFAVLAILVLSPALRVGKILAPVDLYYDAPVFAPARPAEFDEPANPHLFDQAYQFVPWRHLAWDRLRALDIPLWNPDSATGSPFVATMQSAVFYPINLLTLTLPFETTFVFSALLRLWIAGITTYALLRRYGSSRAAGLLSGTSFMLSGFVIGWLGHPHTNAAIWLPALILAVDGSIEARVPRSMMRWWVFLAAVTGVQFLGGHIETSRDILLAAGAYAIVRSVQRRRAGATQRIGGLVLAGSAVLAGACLAAIQLAPFLEWLPLSSEFQARSGGGFDVLNIDPRQWLALPLAALPNLYGNPTWDGEYWSLNPWGSYNEATLYAGTVALGLAIVALRAWREDAVLRAWTWIGGLALALALQLPVIDWLNQLPGMSLGHPGRLRLIAIFAVAVIAGRGLDALTTPLYGERMRQWLARYFIGVVVAALMLAVIFNALFPLMANWRTRAITRYIDLFGDGESSPRSVAVCRDRVAACGDELAAAFSLTNWEMYWSGLICAAALGLIWLAARRKEVRRWLPGALVGLVVLEMVASGLGYNPAVDAEIVSERIAALEIASTRSVSGSRMTALQTDLLPDAHLLYGLSDVRGLDFKTARFERYLDTSSSRLPWIANGVLLDDTDPLILALGVRTVITGNPHIVDREVSEGNLRQIGTYGGMTLLEPASPVARAILVFEADLATSDDAAAGILQADPGRVEQRVIIADSHESREAVDQLGATDESARVIAIDLDAEELRWVVTTAEPALLVVSDLHYPGWRATVDGEAVPLMRANIAFRAVLIPPGEHSVEMRYAPRSFRNGAFTSAGAFVLLALVLGASWIPVPGRRSTATFPDPAPRESGSSEPARNG